MPKSQGHPAAGLWTLLALSLGASRDHDVGLPPAPGPRVPCHGRVAQAHRLPLALAQGVTVPTGPTPFSVLAVPPPVGPTSQEVTARRNGPSIAQVQLLAGKSPFQKPAALQPWGPAVAPVTSWRLGGLRPQRVGVSTQRARSSEPGPGCGLPLSRGPFRQGGQTIRGSQPLSPWEQHRKKQLLWGLSLSPGSPEPPLVQPEAKGPKGRSPRCTGLRAEWGLPASLPAPAEGPPTASCCGPGPSPPQPPQPQPCSLLPHHVAALAPPSDPLRPPILRAWSRMGKQLAGPPPPPRCTPAARDAGPEKKPLPQRSQVSTNPPAQPSPHLRLGAWSECPLGPRPPCGADLPGIGQLRGQEN